MRAPLGAPGVSIVRPVCGIESHDEETLRSAFHLDYPNYEIVFCVALANDPAVALVRALIADHPHVPARLLVGNETIGANPKLNNVCKGWRAAAHDWIVMADCNVLMPRDYIQRLLATWRGGHRPRCVAAGRLPSRRVLGRDRMRLPQYLSGALAIHGRQHRP